MTEQGPVVRSAGDMVQGPAIGLIVTAVLGGIGNAIAFLLNVLGVGMESLAWDPDMRGVFSGTAAMFSSLVAVALAVVVFLGALKMRRLESYGFAVAASILAIIPCISPCCVLGLPFGIWALVVLSRDHVRAAFR